jgi:molybdopterin molybdotransferase
MRTPAEVLSEILSRVRPLEGRESVDLGAAPGRVLAADVASDLDLPPFNKSAVDGYAVRAGDFGEACAPAGERVLRVLGESRAGAPWEGSVEPGTCVAIYTGAELPRGADAVIMVEASVAVESGVRLRDRPAAGAHICPRGQDVQRGQRVLCAGRRLRPTDLALLASVGSEPVSVFVRPRVAVLTTGDELVPPGAPPGPGEIRESNTQSLAALCTRAGGLVQNLGVVRDDPSVLREALAQALGRCDALVTTGGVSMGRYDLVGSALESLGVTPVLHKVAIKPGKPLWFGMFGAVPVFALPGNPVSCVVNHAAFVGPALARMGGESPGETRPPRGRWLGAALAPNPREQYLPVRVEHGEDGVASLLPVRWNGSADVVGIARAEAFAIVPIGLPLAARGLVEYRPLP